MKTVKKNCNMGDENLVIVKGQQYCSQVITKQNQNADSEAILIEIDPIGVLRNRKNESEYLHITSVILPILIGDENKILTVNKKIKNTIKNPKKYFPPLCIDTIGSGHFKLGLVDEKKRNLGLLSMKDAFRQAIQEVNEELRLKDCGNKTPFIASDLTYLGIYPFTNRSNREYSIAFAILLEGTADTYIGSDDFVIDGKNVDIPLPLQGYYYGDLMEMWKLKKGGVRIEDGLGRLLNDINLAENVYLRTDIDITMNLKKNI